jgi:holo-[acyl-carrier protein] synthase
MMSCVTVKGIGIDVADIARFRTSKMRRDGRFICTTFSEREREYCFSYRDYAPHLAGTFAAKEAVRKVFGDEPLAFADIEVRHRASGRPEIWMKGKRSRTVLISITHNAKNAIAVALNQTP